MFQRYKLLHFFTMWSIFTIVIVTITAGKLVDVFGVPISITVFYFPFIYIVADILTEVYGYSVARRVLWYTLGARIISALIFWLVANAPPSEAFQNNDAFMKVLGVAPQIALGGTISVFAGDIVNNYILAKMKVWCKGQYQKARLVISTFAGEFTNTAFFYGLALYGIMPLDNLVIAVVVGSLTKTLVEIVMLPITLKIIAHVKKVEGVDHYDTHTDFNPLKL